MNDDLTAMGKVIAELEQYKEETIWRLTEEDLHDALAEADIPQDEWPEWYEKFRDKFSIHDWVDWVNVFIDVNKK